MAQERGTDDQYRASKRSHADRASNGDPRRRRRDSGELGPEHRCFLPSRPAGMSLNLSTTRCASVTDGWECRAV